MLLVRCASIMPILGFVGLSILELGPGARQTGRQTYGHRPSFHNAPSIVHMEHCFLLTYKNYDELVTNTIQTDQK